MTDEEYEDIYDEEKMKQLPVYPTKQTPSYADWRLFRMGKKLEDAVKGIIQVFTGITPTSEDAGKTIVIDSEGKGTLSSETIGTDTKPIKVVDGVAVAVTNDLMDLETNQNILGVKTFSSANGFNIEIPNAGGDYAITSISKVLVKGTNPSETTWPFSIHVLDKNKQSLSSPISTRFNPSGDGRLEFRSPTINSRNVIDLTVENGYVTAKSREYGSAHTGDVVTQASLATNPEVLHTTGNETKDGKLIVKSLASGDIADGQFVVQDNRTDAEHTIGSALSVFTLGKIIFKDGNGNFGGAFMCQCDTNGVITVSLIVRNSDGSRKTIILGSGDVIQ